MSAGLPIVAARDLYRFFHSGEDETFALRGVSLTLEPGELIAVVGPSGSGKSTLLACLAGLDEPDGGSVSIAGERITRRPEADRARLRSRWIGILRQTGNLVQHLTVGENVQLAQSIAGGHDDQIAVDDLLDEVGVRERSGHVPSTLSGGEAARAGLAVALANDPPLLLADEPTGEVDAVNEQLVLELLQQRAERGRGVLLVTHSTRAALAADRVLQLRDGSIVDA
jgi:putative ABC transport system ATP-binding protein